jgi:hypothetical protein
MFDLKVFLDPDEDLRQQWKLRRDQAERGYGPEQVTAQLALRQPDRAAYILPQRDLADLVLRLKPNGADGSLLLEAQARNGYDLNGVAEALERVEGVAVELQPFLDGTWQQLRLSGAAGSEQLRTIAEAEVPNLVELAPAPRFAGGVNGMMQLVALACLSQRLRWGAPWGGERD